MCYDKFLEMLNLTKGLKNSLYTALKYNFLYHSNKIEGSTFTTDNLTMLLDRNIVEGKHSLDDVQETVNSAYTFDIIIDSLGEKITHSFLKKLHFSLMINTTSYTRGYAGVYKKIPNYITGTNIEVAQPFEVEPKIEELLEEYYNLDKVTLKDIVWFHRKFELIHPFQDGNGRIGRFLMLKQMLENKLPVKIISWDSEDSYREALSKCSKDNYEPLYNYINSLPDFVEKSRRLY